MTSKMIGSFGKYGPNIHVVDAKLPPSLGGGKSRHVELRNPIAGGGRGSKQRLLSHVPPHWTDEDIVRHLNKTHGPKVSNVKWNIGESTDAKSKKKTALSGGEHPQEQDNPNSGNREKIEVASGGNATIKMKVRGLGEGRALTVAQRLRRSRAIRRIKPKLQRASLRSLIQAPNQSRLWKRSQRAARTILKKRFSPVKGVSYNKLTTTQKIFVDRALEKRQKLIRRVATRLLPKVRMASFKRLQSYRTGTSKNRLRENENFEAVFNQKPLPQIIESMIVNMGEHPMADSLMTLLNLSSDKDSPAVKSLKEKAASINAPFAEILQVYADALLEYKKTGMKLTGEQYAFNAVNAYVAERKAPTINEKFEEMNENLAGILLGNHLMFGKTSVISKGFGGGHIPGGGRKDNYAPARPKDERQRGLAIQDHARELHAAKVKAAGDDPARHRFVPNQSWNSKAKHPSRHAQSTAQAHDEVHKAVIAHSPKEYAVSPQHAITAYFNKNPNKKHLEAGVRAYDGHYQNNNVFKEETINEVVITRSHGPETDKHHLFWKGEHGKMKFGDLTLTSKGDTPDQHHYSMTNMAGVEVKGPRGNKVSATLQRWGEILTPHLQRHDAKRTILKQKKSPEKKTDGGLGEVWLPSDAITDHAVEVVNTIRGKGPIKKQIANVAKTTGTYVKMTTAEKLKNIKAELKKRREMNKETD